MPKIERKMPVRHIDGIVHKFSVQFSWVLFRGIGYVLPLTVSLQVDASKNHLIWSIGGKIKASALSQRFTSSPFSFVWMRNQFDWGNYIGDFNNLYSPPYCLHVVPVSRRNAPLIWRVQVMEINSIDLPVCGLLVIKLKLVITLFWFFYA